MTYVSCRVPLRFPAVGPFSLRRARRSSAAAGTMPAMSSYDDIASTAAFLAGRDAAREVRRDGVGWGPDDGHRMLPGALHPDDAEAWSRGWRSIWA